MGQDTTEYYLDGGKIVKEARGDKVILYIYDAEGMVGFQHSDFEYPRFFVKDTLGNVVALLDDDKEVARYEYDAWGNCKALNPDGTENTSLTFIGNVNPIRWKSQYFDVESGLYYINGRYYSPLMKQYINAANPETVMANAAVVYGLNLYLLTLANPVNICYNICTVATNADLVYDAPELSKFQLWWSKWGGLVAIGLLTAAMIISLVTFIFCPPLGIAMMGVLIKGLIVSGLTFLAIGAAVADYQSSKTGKNFWRCYESYINDNWSMSLAMTCALTIVNYGVMIGQYAVARAAAKAALANSLTNQEARDWYVKNVRDIGNRIDKGLPLEDQARQASALRNEYKIIARDAMIDRATAAYLDVNMPAYTFDDLMIKYSGNYQEIINASMRTNAQVNAFFGIT